MFSFWEENANEKNHLPTTTQKHRIGQKYDLMKNSPSKASYTDVCAFGLADEVTSFSGFPRDQGGERRQCTSQIGLLWDVMLTGHECWALDIYMLYYSAQL